MADPCGGVDELTASAIPTDGNTGQAGWDGPLSDRVALRVDRIGRRRKESALGRDTDTFHGTAHKCYRGHFRSDPLVLVGSLHLCSVGVDELGIGGGPICDGVDTSVAPTMARYQGLSKNFGDRLPNGNLSKGRVSRRQEGQLGSPQAHLRG